ncbi:uncharacterized protein LOC142241330 [Haematobia irritans]|uniref:uncharacterized protein LOC142241330 n=1 Tax=Haematobia irritans TaxID=7368 RepID=UPI003F508024
MLSIKYILTFGIAILALSIALVSAISRDWGIKVPSETLIHQLNIDLPKKSFKKHTVLVNFPGPGKNNPSTITRISQIDHGSPTNWATTYLRSGGPGFQNATLEVNSQKSKLVNVTLRFYAKKEGVHNQYIN